MKFLAFNWDAGICIECNDIFDTNSLGKLNIEASILIEIQTFPRECSVDNLRSSKDLSGEPL